VVIFPPAAAVYADEEGSMRHRLATLFVDIAGPTRLR
jgi:hypothetical protein